MINRRGIALRWRIAILTSLTVALLSFIAVFAVFEIVRSTLVGDSQRALREDVARVAKEYDVPLGKGPTAQAANETPIDLSSLTSVATGGPIIQLYRDTGDFLASSNDDAKNALRLDARVVQGAAVGKTDWRGKVAGQSVQAALAPVTLGVVQGVVAVIAPTEYIDAALAQLSRLLLFLMLLLTLFSVVLGYLVAATAARPVTQLARAAATLGPENLEPIPYRGPNDEVGQLSAALNNLVARLKFAMMAQRTFLAETSHELRTPLTSLQGFLDRAVRHAPPEMKEELEDAQRISHSMSRLVTDLLQLTRGQLVRDMVPYVVDAKEDVLAPVADEFPGVRIEAAAGHMLLGDPDRLQQLVRNLTANAVRACARPEQVCLVLEPSEDTLTFHVRDSGPGIDPELLPHIFDIFQKGSGGGSGLGLAIARQIAEAHGGSLEVASTLGEGTTFTFAVPALVDDEDDALV